MSDRHIDSVYPWFQLFVCERSMTALHAYPFLVHNGPTVLAHSSGGMLTLALCHGHSCSEAAHDSGHMHAVEDHAVP